MMMQLQAGVNFSCLQTFCTKTDCIYSYLYISGGFKIFANSCIYIYNSPLQISKDLCSASIFTAADSWPLEKVDEYSLVQLAGHLRNHHVLIHPNR